MSTPNHAALCSTPDTKEKSSLDDKTELGKAIWPFADEAGRSEIYADPNQIELPIGFNLLGNFEYGNKAAGYVAHCPDHKKVVIAFQGTADLADVVTDLNVFRTALYFRPVNLMHFWRYFTRMAINKKVHSGFMRNYVNVQNQIENILPMKNVDHYYLTGHSLGGALATLGSIHVRRKQKGRVSMVNYGSPRLGETNFVRYYQLLDIESFRFVNDRDIIPRLPFKEWGYIHVPIRITITEDGDFVEGSATSEFHDEMGNELNSGALKGRSSDQSLISWFENVTSEFKNHYRDSYGKFLA